MLMNCFLVMDIWVLNQKYGKPPKSSHFNRDLNHFEPFNYTIHFGGFPIYHTPEFDEHLMSFAKQTLQRRVFS